MSVRTQAKSGGNIRGIARVSLFRSTSFIHAYCCLSCPSLMPPVVWHSCVCCANMEQNAPGGWGDGVFAAGGCGEKLSWGVQHKAWQWLAEGKECGQQQNHSAPAQQREKEKSSKESPLDNGTQKAFSSSGQFLHHQHFPCPSLAVGFALQSTQCTYRSLPVHPADKLDASPLACWQLPAAWWEAVAGSRLVLCVF